MEDLVENVNLSDLEEDADSFEGSDEEKQEQGTRSPTTPSVQEEKTAGKLQSNFDR